MDSGRQRALVRKFIAARKQQQQGGASASASKVVAKGKRKNNGQDDCLNKKGTAPFVGDKQLKPPSPPQAYQPWSWEGFDDSERPHRP